MSPIHSEILYLAVLKTGYVITQLIHRERNESHSRFRPGHSRYNTISKRSTAPSPLPNPPLLPHFISPILPPSLLNLHSLPSLISLPLSLLYLTLPPSPPSSSTPSFLPSHPPSLTLNQPPLLCFPFLSVVLQSDNN